MKLPNIHVVYRDERRDPYRAAMPLGVEPSGLWDTIKKIGGKVKPFACLACRAIPNPALKATCMAASC